MCAKNRKGTEKAVLSGQEYCRLLKYTKQRGNEEYYCLIRILALSGIRISELPGCSVEALENGKFTICNKRKIRKVSIPQKLVGDLKCYCRRGNIVSGPIFLGNYGKTINRVLVYKMLVHLAMKVEIP